MANNNHCDFDWSQWASRFPELADIFSKERITSISEEAALIFNPTRSSIVCSEKERRVIFNLLVAHCVEMEKRIASGNPFTGEITSVSEGSISISGTASNNGSNNDLNATIYGRRYKLLTLKYRTFRYKRPIPDRRNKIFP